MTATAPILWKIVEKHLGVAQIAWFLWTRAVAAPNYTLAEVAHGPEERLFAQLSGLAAAGEETAERLLVPALRGDELGNEPDRIAVASLALLVTRGGLDVLSPALRGAPIEERAPMARALGLARGPGLEDGIEALLADGDPAVQAAALDALAARGLAPAELRGLLASRDPGVLVAALGVARHAGVKHRNAIEAAVHSPVSEIRDAALEAGISLGLRVPWLVARELVEARQPGCGPALSLLAMSGEPSDLERMEAALAVPKLRGAAIWALGFSGWPRAVELCLPHLASARHARIAGEAISAITGLAIEKRFMREEEPPPEEPIPFEEEDLDADLVPGPERALPLPEPDAIERWWRGERYRFQESVRYLGGRPIGLRVMLQTLAKGPMRRRYLVALELAARSQGAFWIETRAWAREQMAAMDRQTDARPELGMGFRWLLRQ
jgi:uncharacterized protein (TIGR02270 family)